MEIYNCGGGWGRGKRGGCVGWESSYRGKRKGSADREKKKGNAKKRGGGICKGKTIKKRGGVREGKEEKRKGRERVKKKTF